MVLGKFDRYMQKHETRPPTYNSTWIKALNISCKTIKILEENIGNKISDIFCSNIFANMSPRARETKEKINKWDYIKLKSFCTAKTKLKSLNKIKREPTEWENIFTNDTTDKGLISKIYKELIQLNIRKTIQLKNGQRTNINIPPKRTHSWTIKEMQIKNTTRYNLIPSSMATINEQQVLARMWGKGNPRALLVGMHMGAATLGKSMEFPQKVKNQTAI